MNGDQLLGDIWFKRCDGIQPTIGWATTCQVSSGGIYSWPVFQIDPVTLRIWLLTEMGSSTVQTCYSDNDGYSFSSLTTLASSYAQFPTIQHNDLGDMVRGWVQNNQITLQFRGVGNQDQTGTMMSSGNTDWSTSYNPTCSGSILTTNTSFHLSQFGNGNYWLLNTVQTDSQTITSYFSVDNCVTFTQLGSSYTDASSGYHSRISVSSDGDIIRFWLRGDSSIGLQSWDNVNSNWLNLVVPTNNGSTIYCNIGGYGHIEFSNDYSNQLSMLVVLLGNSVTSNLFSVDGGSSFSLVGS